MCDPGRFFYSHGMKKKCPAALAALAVLATACAKDVAADAPAGDGAASESDAVVVGALSWRSTASLPAGSAERANALATGSLDLPAAGQRCTAFLIAPDVVLTNQHCVKTAAAAESAAVSFAFEDGALDRATYACGTFIGNDAQLDYALLRCEGRPGDARGVVALEDRAASFGEDIYVLHQNCDWATDPSCAPTKKISDGFVTDVGAEIAHDADTLGGSSGAPVFSSLTHQVIGLHHAGVGGDALQRGRFNRAVPSWQVLQAIRARFPSIELGARAVDEPADALADALEPNDDAAHAPALPAPFGADDLAVASAADLDFYVVEGGAPRTITITFAHARGDLDLYVRDETGVVLAQSNSVTDQESATLAAPQGRLFVEIVGYQGATGPYSLSVR